MAGIISYPRVDNTVYPDSLDLADVVRVLSKVPAYAPYCQKLLSKGALSATRGKQETTDHPPIYPTAPADPDSLDPAQWKLYNLIARRAFDGVNVTIPYKVAALSLVDDASDGARGFGCVSKF